MTCFREQHSYDVKSCDGLYRNNSCIIYSEHEQLYRDCLNNNPANAKKCINSELPCKFDSLSNKRNFQVCHYCDSLIHGPACWAPRSNVTSYGVCPTDSSNTRCVVLITEHKLVRKCMTNEKFYEVCQDGIGKYCDYCFHEEGETCNNAPYLGCYVCDSEKDQNCWIDQRSSRNYRLLAGQQLSKNNFRCVVIVELERIRRNYMTKDEATMECSEANTNCIQCVDANLCNYQYFSPASATKTTGKARESTTESKSTSAQTWPTTMDNVSTIPSSPSPPSIVSIEELTQIRNFTIPITAEERDAYYYNLPSRCSIKSYAQFTYNLFVGAIAIQLNLWNFPLWGRNK